LATEFKDKYKVGIFNYNNAINKRFWNRFDIYPVPNLKYFPPKIKEPEFVLPYKFVIDSEKVSEWFLKNREKDLNNKEIVLFP